jgi:hypothetical protein
VRHFLNARHFVDHQMILAREHFITTLAPIR